MTSVLIIDDHPLVRQGCRRLLEGAGAEPIFCVDDFVSGYALLREDQPDVVVLDLSFGDGSLAGLSLVRRIRADGLETRVIVFSMHDDRKIVERCLNAGASAYLVKDAPPAELVKAVLGTSTASPLLDTDRETGTGACLFSATE